MPTRTQNHINFCWPNTSHASENTKCVKESFPYQPTRNVTQLLLTKLVECQKESKMNFNFWWANPSHASKDKCISTCVKEIPPMPVRTRNLSQILLTKRFPCKRIDQTPLKKANTESIWTWVDQTSNMPARKQNSSQHALTENMKCHQEQKMKLSMRWSRPSHACEDTNPYQHV